MERTKKIQTITNSGKDDLVFYFGTENTVPVMYGTSAAELQNDLNALVSIGAAGGVTVTGPTSDTWTFTFDQDGNQPAILAQVVTFKGQALPDETAGTSSSQEVQKIENDITDNDLVFTFGSDSTVALPSDASADTLQAALNGLAGISSAGGVTVSDPSMDGWTITFNHDGQQGLIGVRYDADVDSAVFVPGAVNTQEEQNLTVSSPTQEIQTISTNAASGSFSLSYNGATTGPLAYDASAADVQSALCALAGIGPDGVLVTGDHINGWQVTFATAGAKLPIYAIPVTGGTLTTTTTVWHFHQPGVQSFSNSGKDDLLFSFGSEQTDPVMYGASAADVQNALNGLLSLEALGGVTVTSPSSKQLDVHVQCQWEPDVCHHRPDHHDEGPDRSHQPGRQLQQPRNSDAGE